MDWVAPVQKSHFGIRRDDFAQGIDNPLSRNGFVKVPDRPGPGIDVLNEELLAEYIYEKYHGQWEPTDQ